MGDIIQRKIYLCLTAVMSIFLLTAAFLCFKSMIEVYNTPDINFVRTQVNQLVHIVEETNLYESETEYPYAVILTDGTVAYNNGLQLNNHVNIHQLGSDQNRYYLTPFVTKENICGFIYIELFPYFCGKNEFAFIGWGVTFVVTMIFAVLMWIIIYRTIKQDIFRPVKELHESTHQILCGSMDQSVSYDYDGEMGTLCHDFELMRTELADGCKREIKLKEDEKLLMASISHDLKTPLTTVQGYLESICIGVVTSEEEIKEYCQSALNKTVLLSKMTNDILDHSKLELRQLSIQMEEVYSDRYFKPVLESLQKDASSRGMELQYSDIEQLLLRIDPMRITQVMENIIGNCFKYGRKDGSIMVTFAQQNGFLYVMIKDNGQGIDPEDLPFVFDRFFRGSKARKRGIGGSGLGLSIARYIMIQHGGSIECDSILGSWTEIRLGLPIC